MRLREVARTRLRLLQRLGGFIGPPAEFAGEADALGRLIADLFAYTRLEYLEQTIAASAQR